MVLKKVFAILLTLLLAFPALAAFEYDGTGDSHVANNPNAGASDEYTVCAKVYSTSLGDYQAIFGYGNGKDSNNGRGFMLATWESGALVFYSLAGADAFVDFSGVVLSSATWHWICVVDSPSSTAVNVYVDYASDGADLTTAVDPPTAPTSTDDFYVSETIPEATGLGYSNFVGRQVYVAYWTKALTTTQIESIHDDSTCPTDIEAASLKVWLPLTASPATEGAQSLSVTTNGDPTLVSDPTLASCGGGGGGADVKRRKVVSSR